MPTLKRLSRLLKCPSLLPTVSISPLFFGLLFLAMTRLAVPTDIVVFAFVLIQTKVMNSMYRGINRSSILNTVSRDAGLYFALITSSHFLTVIMCIATSVGFFLPVSEFYVY